MEGIGGAMARVTELQARLSGLRQPSPPGAFSALLTPPPAAVPHVAASAAAAVTTPSATWLSTQRPASLAPAVAPAPSGLTYPNGQVPDAALTSIGGGARLTASAAEGFVAMRAAAARDGVRLPVNDSYRSLAEQEDMARRKGLYSEGGLAARPGTSTHGLGLSVDLQLDDRAQAWMREHGREFGFAEDVPREPWHWTFSPGAT